MSTQLSRVLKPHPAEASLRLQRSTLALLVLLITVYLTPIIPTLGEAYHLLGNKDATIGWFWRWLCYAEIFSSTTLGLTIAQSLYAITYPRPPTPSTRQAKNSPAMNRTPITPRAKRLSVLSPNSSPQPQKPFGSCLSSSTTAGASSTTPFNTPQTPAHLHPAALGTPGSPSPNASGSGTPAILSAYRGMHASRSGVGRPFDAAQLTRLAQELGSDDED